MPVFIAVLSEVILVINYGLWAVGLAVMCFVLIFLCMLMTGNLGFREISFGENRSCEDTSPHDRSDMPATAGHILNQRAQVTLSTLDILDRCKWHRDKLAQYHSDICARVGTDSQAACPLTDMVTAAVYDGRHVVACIDAVTRYEDEKKTKSMADDSTVDMPPQDQTIA